ncbi:hypothetical protein Tco_0938311 [Tanacetum coccineum]|uniref:Transposase (Putative), gypsy type n=1 Tax=Tanacetum coccineum TaxID=301880 RepID=A0ABQ5DJI0_9ASTR
MGWKMGRPAPKLGAHWARALNAGLDDVVGDDGQEHVDFFRPTATGVYILLDYSYPAVRDMSFQVVAAMFDKLEDFSLKYPKWFVKWYSYMGTLPETFPQTVLAGYNQYKVLFKQDGIPSFEYTLQFSATFKLPWILSFTHKKKEAEGTSPPLLIRQFSAKWWKVIKESQADKSAVDKYHKSLMPRVTSVSPSSSASGSTMTNKEIAQRIKDYSNNEALLEKFINEIRGSPTPSENLFQDSQDPKFAAAADEHLVQFLAMPEEEGHTIHKGCHLILVLMYQVNELQSRELKRLGDHRVVEDIDFEGVIYSEFCHIIRKLVIIAHVSYFYVKIGVQLNIGLKQLKTDEDLKEFVKAGSENDFKMDIYTEHNGYNVMEMIRNDNLIDEVDDPPFSDTESQDSLGDVKEVADFQTEDDSNVEIPKISSDDPWLNKLVGKGKFIGHMDDPIPNFNGRFMIEIDDPEQEVIDSQYKAKKEVQYPAFDPKTPWDQCKPFLGMRFETPTQLKQCLANYRVAHGYQLWYMQNDIHKLQVLCGRNVSEVSKLSKANRELAQKVNNCENDEEFLRLMNHIKSSPTPSEDLFQDSQDPYDRSPPKRCRESPAPASPAPALHSVPVELLPPRKRFTASERIKTLKREVVTLTARLVAVEIQIDAFQRDDIGRDVKETRLEARVKRLEDAMQRR